MTYSYSYLDSKPTCQSLLPGVGLLGGLLPGLLELLGVALEELGAVGVLHQLLPLGEEVEHHLALVPQLVQHLVLLLDVLLRLLAAPTNQLLD